LKIYISQGCVQTQLRCGGIFNNHCIANFSWSSAKKIRKIGQYLVKILTKVSWHVFIARGVEYDYNKYTKSW